MIDLARETDLADRIFILDAAINTLDNIVAWKADPGQRTAFVIRRDAYLAARRALNAELTATMRANNALRAAK